MAIALTLTLFLFWLSLGHVLLGWLHKGEKQYQSMLLAPAVGMAVNLLAIYCLNHLGLPVKHFAVGLAGGLLIFLGLLAFKVRPAFPFRPYLPFWGALLVGLLLTGRPLLEFGFNWMSYANTDMQLYCYGANRLLKHGFFDLPTMEEIVKLQDASQFSFFADVPRDFNLGAAALLAWVMALTGLTAYQIYMPVMLSLHMVVISAAGGLVCWKDSLRNSALLICLLLATSPLNSLATLYQLMPHVMGVSLLACSAGLLLRPFNESEPRSSLRLSLLIGMVLSALFVAYNMVFLFFLLPAACLFWLLSLKRREIHFCRLMPVLGLVVLVFVFLCNLHLHLFIYSLREGLFTKAVQPRYDISATLFHHYLVPSGLATVWGFQTVFGLTPEPWLSTSIVLGALLLLLTFVATIRMAFLNHAVACIALVMLCLSIYLFVQRSDFALYKLAMYVQPFVLGTLVVGWGHTSGPRWQIPPLLVLGLAGLPAQFTYVEISRDNYKVVTGRALAEILDVSKSQMAEGLRRLIERNDSERVLSDTYNSSIAMFQALYLRGKQASFPSNMLSHSIPRPFLTQMLLGTAENPLLRFLKPEVEPAAISLSEAFRKRFLLQDFLAPNGETTKSIKFWVDTLEVISTSKSSKDLLIASSPKHSIVNRFHFPAGEVPNFVLLPLNRVRNHLILIHDLYQLEKDYFLHDETMAGIGRYCVGQVVHPTDPARLILSLTGSLKGDGENRLPVPSAVGSNLHMFPVVGRGSARVISPLLYAQAIAGRRYVGLDMGVDGQLLPKKRTGLMRLYGVDVPLDRRKIVCFVRDISLISDDEYKSLTPPSHLECFPNDLSNKNLEYSGMYEDGWISEEAFFDLLQKKHYDRFVIRGMIPSTLTSSYNSISLRIDGTQVLSRQLQFGEFELVVPIKTEMDVRRRVEIRFSQYQRLPAPDRRPVAALVRYIGFTTQAGSTQQLLSREIVESSLDLRLQNGCYPVETFNGETFRWVSNDAEVVVSSSEQRIRKLNILLEPGPGVVSKAFELEVRDLDGRKITKGSVKGRATLGLNLRMKPGVCQTFLLHIEGGGKPAANDPRILNFRVFKLSLD